MQSASGHAPSFRVPSIVSPLAIVARLMDVGHVDDDDDDRMVKTNTTVDTW